MIKIEVEDYCHCCMDFEADVKKAEKVMAYDGEMVLIDTIIRCAYRNRCLAIERYLRRCARDNQF